MSVISAEFRNLAYYAASTIKAARSSDLFTVLSPIRFLVFAFNAAYILVQGLIVWSFKPHPPRAPNQPTKPRGRIAVIGAGLTGVSSAAHAVAHGFDVVIFEQGDKVGGIWTHVNSTSGLQLNSLLYRFHPGIIWTRTFPLRDEILAEIERIWKEYKLENRTRFNTRVTSVRRAYTTSSQRRTNSSNQRHPRWVINRGEEGDFDAIIVTVGTCGKPKMIKLEGMPAMVPNKEHNADRGRSETEVRAGGKKGSSSHRNQSETSMDSANGKHGHDGQGSAWTSGRYEPLRDLERDQVNKKDAGFPAPGEVYQTSPDADPQKGTKAKSLLETRRGSGQEGEDVFIKGPVVHSSELDKLSEEELKGKTVTVIGSGASGVESVETAFAKGAKKAVMLAREDKWIIPRNIVVDTLIAAQPFGREMPLSFLWENLITLWNYHGVRHIAPKHLGLFESTPVVNDTFLYHVREGSCRYVRCDVQRLTQNGVRVNVRDGNSKPGDKGVINEIEGDVVVLATGYEKPEISFLEEGLFPEGYDRPNLYLQNFSTEDWSVLMTNSAYLNAIGTVGHFHIGIYTRILLTLLMDENARPSPKDMKLWVDVIRFIKRNARGGALGFFTYMELTIWLVLFHVLRPDRIKWALFILCGWDVIPRKYRQSEAQQQQHA